MILWVFSFPFKLDGLLDTVYDTVIVWKILLSAYAEHDAKETIVNGKFGIRCKELFFNLGKRKQEFQRNHFDLLG